MSVKEQAKSKNNLIGNLKEWVGMRMKWARGGKLEAEKDDPRKMLILEINTPKTQIKTIKKHSENQIKQISKELRKLKNACDQPITQSTLVK